ncbi:DUF6457 domain-containing protein [Actinocrispum wychmicini]|uniref:DUF6457 domain-containing protein n=1 Tax=Actinocrispum wychmicini TaxID=1213861 RepID=A0A4R2JE19_9PSEU|nr:DUF6457 domain-containing protein [Actinocrispum wychmicini]TCO55116.1 hypothetical protein EV192_108404 [Actinocrispum wychmicini]
MNVITEWTDLAAAELGVPAMELDTAKVLTLSRYVARDVCGAAAPLTFYLVGIAVGRGMSLVEAVTRVSALVERWRGVDWRD